MSLKLWPQSERPREKLLHSGAESLSDAELIALLLGSGSREKDVLALSRDLISTYGGFRGLLSLDAALLAGIKGLGPAKIAAILAVIEISRRFLKENITGKSFIREPQAVLDYLSADLRDRKKEFFKVLFLDKANCIIEAKNLFVGTVDQAAVHPREIIKEALEYHASALVLVHNHPSGKAEPSREDRELTARLAAICEGISLKILDHLIIGDNRFFSFREHGLL